MKKSRLLIAHVAALGLPFLAHAAFAADSPSASRGNAFNPDTSVNILGLYRHSNLNSSDPGTFNGLLLQEAELQLTSAVDPYFRASALFSVHPDDAAPDEFKIDAEEVFAETTSLPYVTFRLGKFKAPIGRTNLMHAHAYPFIDATLVNTALLGDEGLNEVSVSASALLPTPWYSEFIADAMRGSNAKAFASASSNDLAGAFHLKNLWELGDSATAELGLTYGTGANAHDAQTRLYGGDFTLKWRPVEGGKYTSLAWTTEYLGATRQGDPSGEHLGGMGTWLQYQFLERWWVQGRAEKLGMPKDDPFLTQKKWSFLVGYLPSEFSGLRLQIDHTMTDTVDPSENRFMLQYNISIGAHPAHAY